MNKQKAMSLTFEQLIASIRQTLSAKFAEAIPTTIRESLSPESTAVATPTIRGSVTPELNRLFPAGMDNQLFVSKYQLELPKKEEMQRFLAQQLKEVGCGGQMIQKMHIG